MPDHPAVPFRLSRSIVAALLATAAGLVAHLAGGGSLSGPAAAGCAAALLGPIWLAAGRERGWLTIAGIQLTGQQLAHAWLELSSGDAPHVPLPDDVSLYSHLTAAALIAGWLRGGERRAWTAAARVTGAVRAWWRWLSSWSTSPARPETTHPPAVEADRARPGDPLRHVLVRRGPPLPI